MSQFQKEACGSKGFKEGQSLLVQRGTTDRHSGHSGVRAELVLLLLQVQREEIRMRKIRRNQVEWKKNTFLFPSLMTFTFLL